jgi:hypothetical protein
MNPLADPPTRATLALALLGFVLLLVTLVALVMWGARWVRRTGGDLRKPLAERPRLRPSEPAMLQPPIDPARTDRPSADDTVVARPGETTPGVAP